MDVFLIRTDESDQGTFGRLIAPEVALSIHLIELPNRDNEVGFSRIPAGDYICKPYKSPKFGRCWLVTNVPGRSAVLFHKGNLAGDTRKGYKTHSRGCLLPGWYQGKIGAQRAILNSTRAFNEMATKIGLSNSFKLKILEL
ncbi:MAG: hypothetical protein FD166_1470 [Bacteroidetes bacterium]|nr:MAG: hypothetical protein FD166_1470 [Bacteroidota bacterium]